MDTTSLKVHAATLPEGVKPGLWADTAAKLLLVAAAEIDAMQTEIKDLQQQIPSPPPEPTYR